MIESHFGIKLLVQDLDFSDEWNQEVTNIVKSVFVHELATNGGDYAAAGDNSLPLLTPENVKKYPQLKQLQEVFKQGFWDLAQSFKNNKLDRGWINRAIELETGKCPIITAGRDLVRLHTHAGAMAFAIFYLDDIDNDLYGGELVLRDPAFHNNYGFHDAAETRIKTKRHRLVVSPGYVWHEVAPYTGPNDRISVVLNLSPGI